ncbi:hypothetical protein [Streptomyces uncialis]|uniref:hypothetical protein n=1 Tax=Streptomyces uncialis TaxID=1048205 RepID=UPI0015C05AF0
MRSIGDAGLVICGVLARAVQPRQRMKEIFVRRYDQNVPPVPLLDEARALLVIGLHTDRRSVQARARAKGMKIFSIDPEGLMENGTFKERPIEGVREGDTIVRSEATPALQRLCKLLVVTLRPSTGQEPNPLILAARHRLRRRLPP